MESSLLFRKPSSHVLLSGRSVSGDQLGMELVGTRNLLHGFAATTKRTSEENPDGNDGENSKIPLELSLFSKGKTTDESSSSFSECKVSEPILLHGFTATTKPTSEENPEGNVGEKSNISLELSLSKGKTTDESSSSFSECKVSKPIFHHFLATLENDQLVKIDETESQHGLEEISLELMLGWASNCITNKRKEIENSANLSRSSTACGIKRMKLLGCPDPSLELKLYRPDPWAIKKTIETSDIGNSSRLLLAKKEVEKHILSMWDAGRIERIHVGVRVAVWDFDTQSEHQLTFKKWPSIGGYVLIENWTKEFVKRRTLKKGDEIGLYWDQSNSRFNFTILKEAANFRATSIAG